jgi:predicted DNA-binding transcriptional regulator AlpA
MPRTLKTTRKAIAQRADRKARVTRIATAAKAQAIAAPSTSSGPPAPRLWTVDTVLAFFGGEQPLNISTLYRGMKTGRYPRPINVGGSRWIAEECESALAAIVAKRDTGARSGLGRPPHSTDAAA